MPRGNPDNLIPNSERTPEELRKITRNGGIKSGKKRREKKLMSQIYAEFLEKEHNVTVDGNKKKMSGALLVNTMMKKIVESGDRAAVSMIREIRQGTEGDKITAEIPPIQINVKFDDSNK